MLITNEDNVLSGNVYIPLTVVRLRIIGTSVKDIAPTEKNPGYPMTMFESEIVEPEQIEVGGQRVSLAGRKVYLNAMHIKGRNWGHQRFQEFCAKIGFEVPSEGYNTDAHEQFRGWTFDYWAHCPEEDIMRLPLTPAEKAKGIKQGIELKDRNGKTCSRGWPLAGDLTLVPPDCYPEKVEMGAF